jgi:hypothetical protein
MDNVKENSQKNIIDIIIYDIFLKYSYYINLFLLLCQLIVFDNIQ